jgi:hypothetical protein
LNRIKSVLNHPTQWWSGPHVSRCLTPCRAAPHCVAGHWSTPPASPVRTHHVRCDAALPRPSLSGSDHAAYLLPAPLPPCLHVATGRAPPPSPTSSSALGPPRPPFLPSLLQHSRCQSASTPPSSLRGTIHPLTLSSTVGFLSRRRRHSIPSVSTTSPCSFSANDARLSSPSLILSYRNTSPSLATTASLPPPVNTLASSRFTASSSPCCSVSSPSPMPCLVPPYPSLVLPPGISLSLFIRFQYLNSFIHFQKFVQDS